MRVLLFYYMGFSLAGGVESVVLNLAKALSRRGFPAAIVDLSHERRSERSFQGVPLWSIAPSRFPVWTKPRTWASYGRSVWQLERVCRLFKPDILHVHFPVGQCLPVVGACAFPHGWRLVVTLHGSGIRVYPQDDQRVRVWQGRMFRAAQGVTSVSKALLEDAARLYPCVLSKGQVIYNGVEGRWLGEGGALQGSCPRYVLFAGRLHPAKAVDVLLRAWKLASARFPQVQLWLAGDGPERERLHALARELGIDSATKFLGHQGQDELHQLYLGADLFVLPSLYEGFGMVLAEAGACGCIRLATRIPGVTEVVTDGVDGLLVEPGSPEALAEGITRALSMNADERSRMSAASREDVASRFTLDSIVSQYQALYRGVLGQTGDFAASKVTNRAMNP
jgi:glycosyltransferase involved in cell wall biosynthesis